MRGIPLAAILAALICLAGCNKPGVILSGDMLVLPPGVAWYKVDPQMPAAVRRAMRQNMHDIDYYKWDGKYPENWPAALKMPPDFYHERQGQLLVKPALNKDPIYAGVKTTVLNGATRMKPQQLSDFFVKELTAGGWKSDPPNHQVPEGQLQLGFRPPQAGDMDLVWFTIMTENAGEWCFFTGVYSHRP